MIKFPALPCIIRTPMTAPLISSSKAMAFCHTLGRAQALEQFFRRENCGVFKGDIMGISWEYHGNIMGISILDWDFPFFQPSSYYGIPPFMETSIYILKF